MENMQNQFEEELRTLLSKYHIGSPAGLFLIDCSILLQPDYYERFHSLSKESFENLQRMAEANLMMRESLGEAERQHLVNICDGRVPEPFFIRENKKNKGVQNEG